MRSIHMLIALFRAFLALSTSSAIAQTLYFPPSGGGAWETVAPSSLG